jgi:hypothetical protein
VDPKYSGTPGDLRLPADFSPAALAPWTALAKSMSLHASVGILQLVHTGRQSVRCAGRWPWEPPLGPSAVRVSTNPPSWVGQLVEKVAFQVPRAMTTRDIEDVTARFVRGARLARVADFQGAQLHARCAARSAQSLWTYTDMMFPQPWLLALFFPVSQGEGERPPPGLTGCASRSPTDKSPHR